MFLIAAPRLLSDEKASVGCIAYRNTRKNLENPPNRTLAKKLSPELSLMARWSMAGLEELCHQLTLLHFY